MKLKLQSKEVKNLINEDLKKKLMETKLKINQYAEIKVQRRNYITNKWDISRSLLNKYETIPYKKNKINRAYFKLQEMMKDGGTGPFDVLASYLLGQMLC